jgi:choline dehydrogenase-like flavoprotein
MPAETFDVCVIGSGAAGGTLAGELTRRGARVALIEAGQYRDPSKLRTHAWPYDQTQPVAVPDVTADAKREPVSYEGDAISVSRGRVIGGRTTHWNAVALRFSEDDFREWSVNGVEEDWPISYAELAPYYDQAEELMVVCGTRENLKVLPDGRFIKPLSLRCSETILSRASKKIGMRVIPVRKALATEAGHDRAPCHYCGHCMQGCGVSAIFNTAEHVIPRARRTGRLTLRSGWMVRELRTGDEARIQSALIFERDSRREEEIRADVFAVCGGNIESARLLLNSRSPRFPNGLANNNDIVGRYLHGHITGEVQGYLKDLVGTKPGNQDGALDHAYIPRTETAKGADYAGGYGIQLNVRGYMRPHHARFVPGFGRDFKKQVRDLQPAHTSALAFGKVVAHAANRVTLHPTRVDDYGLPLPHVTFHWQPNDIAMYKAMLDGCHKLYDAAGVAFRAQLNGPGGFASHEVGCVRMGKDPKTSILNQFNQTREIKNLFVVDGSSFTTFPEKNPTLTIVALAIRAAENIMRMKDRGDL